MSQWAVYYDDGTGNNALYGPYRTPDKARQVEAVIYATGIRDEGATIKVCSLVGFDPDDFAEN